MSREDIADSRQGGVVRWTSRLAAAVGIAGFLVALALTPSQPAFAIAVGFLLVVVVGVAILDLGLQSKRFFDHENARLESTERFMIWGMLGSTALSAFLFNLAISGIDILITIWLLLAAIGSNLTLLLVRDRRRGD